MILKVLASFPQQALWQMMAVCKSTLPTRANRCTDLLSKAKSDRRLAELVRQMTLLTDQLLQVCNHPIAADVTSVRLDTEFRVLYRMAPLEVIVPLQVALTVILPGAISGTAAARPFAREEITIRKFREDIEILSSLQRPRKIIVLGSDGKDYIFLCKPKDDLRKDTRLMEFNALVNKLLKKNPEARRRRLRMFARDRMTPDSN